MLRAAMVFMIIAGIFGLPAVICSGCWSGIGKATGANLGAPEGQAVLDFLYYLSLGASFGSIIIGALVTKLKKVTSGLFAFIFAICFGLLLIQGNFLGLFSSLALIIAGVMIFVAPNEQFYNFTNVKIIEKNNSVGRVDNVNMPKKENIQYCTNCGNKLDLTSRFCSECGSKI